MILLHHERRKTEKPEANKERKKNGDVVQRLLFDRVMRKERKVEEAKILRLPKLLSSLVLLLIKEKRKTWKDKSRYKKMKGKDRVVCFFLPRRVYSFLSTLSPASPRNPSRRRQKVERREDVQNRATRVAKDWSERSLLFFSVSFSK